MHNFGGVGAGPSYTKLRSSEDSMLAVTSPTAVLCLAQLQGYFMKKKPSILLNYTHNCKKLYALFRPNIGLAKTRPLVRPCIYMLSPSTGDQTFSLPTFLYLCMIDIGAQIYTNEVLTHILCTHQSAHWGCGDILLFYPFL